MCISNLQIRIQSPRAFAIWIVTVCNLNLPTPFALRRKEARQHSASFSTYQHFQLKNNWIYCYSTTRTPRQLGPASTNFSIYFCKDNSSRVFFYLNLSTWEFSLIVFCLCRQMVSLTHWIWEYQHGHLPVVQKLL